MTYADQTPPSQTQTLAFKFDLKHPPEKVWRALTDPALLSDWLLPVVGFKPEPCAEFKFQAPPQPGWDGTVDCKLVEIEPLRKLCWTWVVGELNTVVTFTLTPTDAGTHMTIVHTGFKENQKHNFAGARYGWKMMADQLTALLEKN